MKKVSFKYKTKFKNQHFQYVRMLDNIQSEKLN